MTEHTTRIGPWTTLAWWLGWYPKLAVAGGALVGFLVGNVVATWGVRALLLRGGLDVVTGPLHRLFGTNGTNLLVLAVIPVAASIAIGALLGLGAWLVGLQVVRRRARSAWTDLVDERPGWRTVTETTTIRYCAVPRECLLTDVQRSDDTLTVSVRRVSVPHRSVEDIRRSTLALSDLSEITYDPERGTTTFETADGTLAVPADDEPPSGLGEVS
ncbi:MAG: hypothetical protein ABEJ77_03695 [Halanaeroarchaeum sp.]